MGEQAGHAFRGNQWVGGIPAGAVDRNARKGEATVLREDWKQRQSVSKAHQSALNEALRRTGFAGSAGIEGHFEAGAQFRAKQEEVMARLQEQALQEHGGVIPEEALSREQQAELDQLQQGEISGIKHLGGGINASYKVTFKDGSKAVFKPENQRYCRDGIRDKGMEREVAAWDIARMVGLTDLVQPTIVREGVKLPDGSTVRGSLQAWASDAKVAADTPNRYGNTPEDVQRAAMFDWVTGNLDRHGRNWMVQNSEKIKLIDHGLSLSSKTNNIRNVNAELVAHMGREEGRGRKGGDISKLIKPYVAKKSAILSYLKGKKFDDASLALVERRINKASKVKTWTELIGNGEI